MKLLIIVCLCVAVRANFLHQVEHALEHAVDTVGDGVKDAAHTVVDGVDTAAHAVGGALKDVGHTLDSTFGAVWGVVKDPLEQAGKEILVQAGTFALEQGITLALNALAAGKRETTEISQLKNYLSKELVDEYGKWLIDVQHQILSSKDEMTQAIAQAKHINQMPESIKKYLQEYADAVVNGNTSSFVNKQADQALKNAISQLKERLQNRLFDAINGLAAH